MEIRRSTLRQSLRTILSPEQVERISETLEPYFQMVQDEEIKIVPEPIQAFSSAAPTVKPEIRENVLFALLHSFMKNFLALMEPRKVTNPNELGKRLLSLIFEWILCEYAQENEERCQHLQGLIVQAAAPA